MFAAALAHALGKSLDDIRHGLRTFDTTFFQAPGRMNVYDEHPFRVILDYGHNPAAMGAVCQLVDRLDVSGRRICVLGAPGDRRDEDILAIADETASHVDHFICKPDDNLRGRSQDEVAGMLQGRLVERGVDAGSVEVITDEQDAVNSALGMAQEDDLVVIFGDNITRCWKQIINFEPEGTEKEASKGTRPIHSFVEEDPNAFSLAPGAELIADERGVRIAARQGDEESD